MQEHSGITTKSWSMDWTATLILVAIQLFYAALMFANEMEIIMEIIIYYITFSK